MAFKSHHRSSKRRVYTQSRPAITLLILAIPVVLIFLSAPMLQEDVSLAVPHSGLLKNQTVSNNKIVSTSTSTDTTSSSSQNSADETTTTKNWPTIVYESVETHDSEILRYAAVLVEDGSMIGPLTISAWANLLAHGNDELLMSVSEGISSVLKESPFDAFRFETKGCNKGNIETKQFEFVLVNDPFLASFAEDADRSAFAEHFDQDDEEEEEDRPPAVVFPNLGYDAILIVPQPLSTITATDIRKVYGHCAHFIRKASESQIVGTWRMVARAYLERVDERGEDNPPQSVWLSTAGTGMKWLHFRLDDRPKYYEFRPFAQET